MAERPIEEAAAERTDAVLGALADRWGDAPRLDPVSLGPRAHDPDAPPSTLDDQLSIAGGIASTVVFYTPERRETVLVYNRNGGWEPPGGVVEADQTPEDAARVEAREETGLSVELTGLLYTRRAEFRYASGRAVDVPVAQFVGHRTSGSLAVEREGRSHPGTTRATGLFDRETLPPMRRDRDRVRRLLADPPPWSPE